MTELWVDNEFEILAVEVKRKDPNCKWEITGIYRAPNADMLAICKLLRRTAPTRNLTRRCIIGGDLNLPQADWSGDAAKASEIQALVNSLVWENG